MDTLQDDKARLSAAIDDIENQPFTDEEKSVHAKVERFQKDRESAMEAAERARKALGISLERKAMLNEEITSRLIRQADWIADMEDIEVYLEELSDGLLSKPDIDDNDTMILKIMEGLDKVAQFRKIMLEDIRKDAMQKASGGSRHLEGDSPSYQYSASECPNLFSNDLGSEGLSPDARQLMDIIRPGPDSSDTPSSILDSLSSLQSAEACVSDMLKSISASQVSHVIDCHSRLKQLDYTVHRNIVTIETRLADDRLTCERSIMNDRLDSEACGRRLLDMYDDEDALINELADVMHRRDDAVMAMIEAAYAVEYKALRDKDSEVKEFSLMYSTATSRLNSLKALQGFLRHRQRLADIRELEDEKERLTEEKFDLDQHIVKHGLLSNNVSKSHMASGKSSRRPSYRSTGKAHNQSISSNYLANLKDKNNLSKTHSRNHSSGASQMVMTFGQSFGKPTDYKKSTVNDDPMRSCPRTDKQPSTDQQHNKVSEHVFESDQDNLVRIKWQDNIVHDEDAGGSHIAAQQPWCESLVQVIGMAEIPHHTHSVQNTKRSMLVAYGSSTSRLFEMRENLRKHTAKSKEKKEIKDIKDAKNKISNNHVHICNNDVFVQQRFNVKSDRTNQSTNKKTHMKNTSFPGSKMPPTFFSKDLIQSKNFSASKPMYVSPTRLAKVD